MPGSNLRLGNSIPIGLPTSNMSNWRLDEDSQFAYVLRIARRIRYRFGRYLLWCLSYAEETSDFRGPALM